MKDLIKGLGCVCLAGFAGSCLAATSFVVVEVLMPKTFDASERTEASAINNHMSSPHLVSTAHSLELH